MDVLLNCLMSDLSILVNIMFVEMDVGFIDDLIGFNWREVCGLVKKEKGLFMFFFVRKVFLWLILFLIFIELLI